MLTMVKVHLTRFLNQGFLKFSGMRIDNPFSNSCGTTSLAVIQELEPEEIVAMSIEDHIDFLKNKGKNRFDKPKEIAEYLKKNCAILLPSIRRWRTL